MWRIFYNIYNSNSPITFTVVITCRLLAADGSSRQAIDGKRLKCEQTGF